MDFSSIERQSNEIAEADQREDRIRQLSLELEITPAFAEYLTDIETRIRQLEKQAQPEK